MRWSDHTTPLALAIALVLVAGCGGVDPPDLVLEGGDGTRLAYDCEEPARLAFSAAEYDLLKDHATRIFERAAGEVDQTAWLEAYADIESGALERLVVRWACEHGVVPARPPVFPEVHSTAPDFALPVLTADGPTSDTVVLGALDRPVVLYFWATWCAPCVAKWPELVAAAEALAADVAVLGIPYHDSESKVTAYLAEHGSDAFPQLWDGDGEVGEAYRINGIPHSYALDAALTVLPACDTCRYGVGSSEVALAAARRALRAQEDPAVGATRPAGSK